MNVLDSSGWLEIVAEGPNADIFEEVATKVDELIVPVITIYEVFKRLLLVAEAVRRVDPDGCGQLRRLRCSADESVGMGGVGGSEDLSALIPHRFGAPVVDVGRSHQRKARVAEVPPRLPATLRLDPADEELRRAFFDLGVTKNHSRHYTSTDKSTAAGASV